MDKDAVISLSTFFMCWGTYATVVTVCFDGVLRIGGLVIAVAAAVFAYREVAKYKKL